MIFGIKLLDIRFDRVGRGFVLCWGIRGGFVRDSCLLRNAVWGSLLLWRAPINARSRNSGSRAYEIHQPHLATRLSARATLSHIVQSCTHPLPLFVIYDLRYVCLQPLLVALESESFKK